MGIELQAFQDTFSELSDEEKLTLYGFALINQGYTSEQAQAYVAALIRFQKLFAAKMESASIRKQLSSRASNRRRPKERCVQLVETLLKIHSRILVVRVDLGLIRDPAKLQERSISLILLRLGTILSLCKSLWLGSMKLLNITSLSMRLGTSSVLNTRPPKVYTSIATISLMPTTIVKTSRGGNILLRNGRLLQTILVLLLFAI